MRLVGGNISDTPVKEIGDGSAFSVAGASGASSVLELGAFTTPADQGASGWEAGASGRANVSTTHGSGHTLTYEVLREGSLVLMVHIRESDDKLYSGSIPVSSGVMGTSTTAVDLSGHFTDNDGAATILIHANIDPLVTDGVVIAKFHGTSTRHVEVGYFTIAADGTPTKVGSIINHNYATNVAASGYLQGLTLSPDGNTGIIWLQNNASTGQLQAIPFNFKTNQGFGTAVATGVAIAGSSNALSTTGLIDGTTNKAISVTTSNRIHEWLLSPGSTPSIAHVEDHTGAALSGRWTKNFRGISGQSRGLNTGYLQKATPDDVLQFCALGESGEFISFSGVTLGKHNKAAPSQIRPTYKNWVGASTTWNQGTEQYVHYDFSTDGEWSRGFICNVGAWNGTGYPPTIAAPMNIHIASGSIYQPGDVTPREIASFGSQTLNRSMMCWMVLGDNLYGLCENYNDLGTDYSFRAAITDPDA
jgi:hypothetical protein